MIEERCPCKKQRLLAIYEPGAAGINLLAAKAEIEVGFAVDLTNPDTVGGAPIAGTARCIRWQCRLLRRT